MKVQDNVILMTAKDQLAAVNRWDGRKDEAFFVYSHVDGPSTNRRLHAFLTWFLIRHEAFS
ncbi:hypothetical protein E2C01_038793 [Portunus trituberculatus]|uniref:Uncharacterized protein n=1 Tax=Portunus trituberculatus TaxID=210409 RepID=A0A5B7FIX6_PORTR|nr:hypothetical protein [Portunus trituberculatus]